MLTGMNWSTWPCETGLACSAESSSDFRPRTKAAHRALPRPVGSAPEPVGLPRETNQTHLCPGHRLGNQVNPSQQETGGRYYSAVLHCVIEDVHVTVLVRFQVSIGSIRSSCWAEKCIPQLLLSEPFPGHHCMVKRLGCGEMHRSKGSRPSKHWQEDTVSTGNLYSQEDDTGHK